MKNELDLDEKARFISVSEYLNGELKVLDYVVNNTVFLPKDIQEGSIVYKCTKEMESSEKDSNYFVIL